MKISLFIGGWLTLFYSVALAQNYEVLSKGASCVVRNADDQKVLKTTNQADQALQWTIDQLPATGGDIHIKSGQFILNKVVRLRNNVWLHGSGRSTVLLVKAPVGFLLQSLRGATISDLTLRADSASNAETGVLVDDSGECQIRNVRVQRFNQYGIAVRNKSFLSEVANCWLADNRRANLYLNELAAGGRGGDYLPNEVKNVICVRGGHGIEVDHALVVNLIGCSVFQPSSHAFYIHRGSNSVLLSGCRSFQVEQSAVVVDASHEINISSNIFCWQRGHGIVLRGANWGSVTGNNVIDSGVRTRDGSSRNGIVLEGGCKGLQLTGNAIFNWGDQVPMAFGIVEDSTGVNNLIGQNNINFFTQQAVQSAGKGTLTNANVSNGPKAYVGMDRKGFPDFDTRRIDAFLNDATR